MELKNFYKLLSPRTTVLVSTIDKQEIPDVAPFSFIMPLSFEPPLLAISFENTRRTLKNILDTKEFVVNIPTEKILKNLWKSAQKYDKDKIKFSGLTSQNSKIIKPPRIKECVAWIECKLENFYKFNTRVLIIGKVVYAEGEEGKAILHVGKNKFCIPEKIVEIT